MSRFILKQPRAGLCGIDHQISVFPSGDILRNGWRTFPLCLTNVYCCFKANVVSHLFISREEDEPWVTGTSQKPKDIGDLRNFWVECVGAGVGGGMPHGAGGNHPQR